MPLSSIQVRVPASTSNLGPGFDCLGLALQLYNTATVARVDGAAPARGMVAETAEAFFQLAARHGVKRFGFEAGIEGDIPVSRGLGSSVSVRLGVLKGLAELASEAAPIPDRELLDLLIALEGHPDNAVPSFLGGFAASAPAGPGAEGRFVYARVPVRPELAFVMLVPELRVSTEKARELLPQEVPLRHAVENVQRTAAITAAFCREDYAALRGLFVDHLHQPFRQALVPGFAAILGAANEAGALGGFLSGSGSTLMALTLEKPEAVAAAMAEAARRHELPAQARVLAADNEGAKVTGFWTEEKF